MDDSRWAIERYWLEWQGTGCAVPHWCRGGRDTFGGPTAELLENWRCGKRQVGGCPHAPCGLPGDWSRPRATAVWRDGSSTWNCTAADAQSAGKKAVNREPGRYAGGRRILSRALALGHSVDNAEPPLIWAPHGTRYRTGEVLFRVHDQFAAARHPRTVFEQDRTVARARVRRIEGARAWIRRSWLAGCAGTGSRAGPAALVARRLAASAGGLPHGGFAEGVWWAGDQRTLPAATAGGGRWVQLASAGEGAALALRRWSFCRAVT